MNRPAKRIDTSKNKHKEFASIKVKRYCRRRDIKKSYQPKQNQVLSTEVIETDSKSNCRCLQCGKEFYAWPSAIKNGGGKYCSRECSGKSQRTKVECICKKCGKTYLAYLSNLKRGRSKYCSRECYGKPPSKRICQHCGKEFYALNSQIKMGFGKYCSRECHTEIQRKGGSSK